VKKPLILAILALLCCIFLALPVLADDGDGSGGGRHEPLTLVSSNPANGQNNIPLTMNLNLTFNKNVVNLAVKDNNMKCFSLSGNGINVPIQVIMPDDQVDFEHRRNIYVNPLQDLKPGTVYKLVISGQLQAKNGMSLGSPVTVSFTATGAAPANQNTNTGQNTNVKSNPESNQQTSAIEKVTTEKTTKDNAKIASKDTKKGEVKSEAKSKNEEKESQTSGRGAAVAAGLVIIAVGGYGYYRYSHKK
jgi:hypothetical protein